MPDLGIEFEQGLTEDEQRRFGDALENLKEIEKTIGRFGLPAFSSVTSAPVQWRLSRSGVEECRRFDSGEATERQ